MERSALYAKDEWVRREDEEDFDEAEAEALLGGKEEKEEEAVEGAPEEPVEEGVEIETKDNGKESSDTAGKNMVEPNDVDAAENTHISQRLEQANSIPAFETEFKVVNDDTTVATLVRNKPGPVSFIFTNY